MLVDVVGPKFFSKREPDPQNGKRHSPLRECRVENPGHQRIRRPPGRNDALKLTRQKLSFSKREQSAARKTEVASPDRVKVACTRKQVALFARGDDVLLKRVS